MDLNILRLCGVIWQTDNPCWSSMAATGINSAEVILRWKWLSSFTYNHCWLKVAEAALKVVDGWSQIMTFINNDCCFSLRREHSVIVLQIFDILRLLKLKKQNQNAARTDLFFFLFQTTQTGRCCQVTEPLDYVWLLHSFKLSWILSNLDFGHFAQLFPQHVCISRRQITGLSCRSKPTSFVAVPFLTATPHLRPRICAYHWSYLCSVVFSTPHLVKARLPGIKQSKLLFPPTRPTLAGGFMAKSSPLRQKLRGVCLGPRWNSAPSC